jgi:hypothetical protein
VLLRRPCLSAAAAAVLLVAAAGAGAERGGVSLLVIEDVGGRQQVLHGEPVTAGARFTLEYVHSSERVPVTGTFRVEPDGRLTVVETAFAGFGPGLPELGPGDDWRIERGMIVHRPVGVSLEALRLRVAPTAAQRLRTPAGAVLDVARMARAGALLLIAVR